LLDGGAGWQKLKADPATLLPLYLREMRRTEHALAVIDRFAKKEVTIGGSRIPEGASVFGVLASANRDKKVFGADADDFDPHRSLPKQQHLGLGWGTHECMGRELEKHITAPALAGLMAAIPGLHLQSTAQPPWFENFYFRSFDHLTVTVK
jgi:cytochrome P450